MSRRSKAVLALATGATAITAATAAVAVGVAAGAFFFARAVRTRRANALGPSPVIVITGGSRGLGLAVAERFAEQPVRLVLCARNRAELEQAQAQLLTNHPHLQPEDFYLIAADLTSRYECERLIAETIAHFGRIDVLINNAGIIGVGPLEAQTPERFEEAMSLMYFAGLYTIWAALPHVRVQQPVEGSSIRGRIVNIASIGGKIAVPHMLPYTGAKFALVGLSEGLHAELRHKGIRVTTVCPGLMRTGGEDHAHFYGDVEAEQKWFKFMAKTPGISTTAKHAANVIYSAVVRGCAEVTITPQAALAARVHGVAPATTQLANAMFNEYVLPKAPAEMNAKSNERVS